MSSKMYSLANVIVCNGDDHNKNIYLTREKYRQQLSCSLASFSSLVIRLRCESSMIAVV
uniref:Uncharacterized protein n=1 Tax=Anguilla anguilla TaxID=7936 RepID=A0A0E9XC16_ANGAN